MRAETQKGRLDEGSSDHEDVLHHLQDIYAQIDDPDGAEGISAHLHIFDPDQQIIDYRRDGRWAAAQSWYELQLADDPNDETAQLDLLTCLKESGQPGQHFKRVAQSLLTRTKIYSSSMSKFGVTLVEC